MGKPVGIQAVVLSCLHPVGLVKNNCVITATVVPYKIWFYLEEGRIKSLGSQEDFIEIIKLGLKEVIDTHQGRNIHETEVLINVYVHVLH